MKSNSRWLCAVLIGFVASLAAARAQTSTSATETKRFEIVAVDGNKVVVKDAQGAKEITVPPDFRLTVDGKPVTVSELKPGMKGTATITTTTTVTPVTVTEVRNAEVLQVSGNSILVKGQNGFRNFTESEIEQRGIKIFKDGQPVKFSDLHTGNRLTATIVTSKPPKVMTQRQVDAAIASPASTAASASSGAGAAVGQSARAEQPAAAPQTRGAASQTRGAASESASSAATSGSSAAPQARLPKTASVWPSVGLFGAIAVAFGALLTVRRRLA